MPRSTSLAYTRDLLDPNSEVFGLVFLEITHPSLSPPIRVVNDVTKLKSDGTPVPYNLSGKLYQAYPFGFAWFNDVETVPEAKLTIQNVDRRIGQAVESIDADKPLQFSLSVYASDDFELNGGGTQMVAVGTPTQQLFCPIAFLRNVTVDAGTVSGSVQLFDPSREPAVCKKCSPETAPGLFIA